MQITKIAKQIIKTYYRALGYFPVNIAGLNFKCDPYHLGFWIDASRSRWEPQTYKILSEFLNSDSVYCDIGAWIGPTAIYAAKKCRQVICFEPDPVAYQYLLWNISLNRLSNVMPFNIALASPDGIVKMASFTKELGDRMTSLLDAGQKEGAIDVLALTWETWSGISRIGKIDFFKIDIEGGEFTLIPTIKDYLLRHKPIVYLSTHTPFFSVDTRREQMARIVEVMNIYKRCLNENLQPVSLSELTGEKALSQLQAYVFMD